MPRNTIYCVHQNQQNTNKRNAGFLHKANAFESFLMILDGRNSFLLKASATENVEGLQGLPAKRRLAGIVTINAYRGCSNNSLKGGRYGIPKPLQLCLPRAGCGQNYVVCFCLIPSSLFVFVRCCQFRFFVLWVCLLLSDVVCFIIGFVWYHQLLFLLSLILFACLLCWAPLPASPSALSLQFATPVAAARLEGEVGKCGSSKSDKQTKLNRINHSHTDPGSVGQSQTHQTGPDKFRQDQENQTKPSKKQSQAGPDRARQG